MIWCFVLKLNDSNSTSSIFIQSRFIGFFSKTIPAVKESFKPISFPVFSKKIDSPLLPENETVFAITGDGITVVG